MLLVLSVSGLSFYCRQCRGSFAVEVSVALLFLSSSFSGPLSVAVSVGPCFFRCHSRGPHGNPVLIENTNLDSRLLARMTPGERWAIPGGCCWCRHCRACHSVVVSVGALLLLKSVSRFFFFRRHSLALFLLLSVSGLVFCCRHSRGPHGNPVLIENTNLDSRLLARMTPGERWAIPGGCCWCRHCRACHSIAVSVGASFCCRQCRGLPENPVLGRIHRTGFPPAGENDTGGAMAIPGGCCWCRHCRACHSIAVIVGASFAVEVSVALLFLSSSFSGLAFFRRQYRACLSFSVILGPCPGIQS